MNFANYIVCGLESTGFCYKYGFLICSLIIYIFSIKKNWVFSNSNINCGFWDLCETVSKMLHVVTPSLSVVSSQPSTSMTAESSSSANNTDPAFLDYYEELARKPKNLSSTLQKLYLWEKKLYNEVKVYCVLMICYPLLNLVSVSAQSFTHLLFRISDS